MGLSAYFLFRWCFGLLGEQILALVKIGDCHPVGLPVFFCGSFFILSAHFGVGHGRMGIVIGLCHAFPVVLLGLTPLYVGHVGLLRDDRLACWGFLEDHVVQRPLDFFN